MDTTDTKEAILKGFIHVLLNICLLGVLGVLCGERVLAQFEMPDPKQMSGIPRPDGQMPAGSVSVRLIRGDLSNNITGHPVELHIGDKVQTVKTDENGRADFSGLTPGSSATAIAVVDGERLESQAFPIQAQGGVRLMLVATDKDKERQKAEEARLPPVNGTVIIGGDSRIVIEPNEETASIFYILEIMNTARAPVNPATPFLFDVPKAAVSTNVLQGSSPLASSQGNHVRVAGPFPSGKTTVQIGIELPLTDGALNFSQAFPASMESFAIIAKKAGDMKLTSPQIAQQQDTAVEGTPVIIGAGGTVAAGQPFSVSLSGLPHHSSMPRRVALSLAAAVILAGLWASTRKEDPAVRTSERQRLVARREKLFQDLVRLEHDHRRGRVDDRRFAARREELLAALEQVYGALDSDDMSPEPAGRSGVAA
jgi:hypothetical protein